MTKDIYDLVVSSFVEHSPGHVFVFFFNFPGLDMN